MPKVSIVVPAYRPEFLDTCIASAVAQTFRDFELLVGDDCPGDDVAAVVGKWDDPRIRYGRNPAPRQPGSNRDFLLSRASGEYVKFLFDDDFLLPRSLELLCGVAEQLDAKLVFHERYVVDDMGRPAELPLVLPSGGLTEVTPHLFFDTVIRRGLNWIGEPSNVLVHLETLRSMAMPFGIDGHRARFLTDVALYTNLAREGHRIVGLGYRGSAFRSHLGQTSGRGSPVLAAGMFEWELLARWSADGGHLDADACSEAISARHEGYQPFLGQYPELGEFVALGHEPDASGRFDTGEFRSVLEQAWARIDERALVRASA